MTVSSALSKELEKEKAPEGYNPNPARRRTVPCFVLNYGAIQDSDGGREEIVETVHTCRRDGPCVNTTSMHKSFVT